MAEPRGFIWGATININHISKQQKTQEEEKKFVSFSLYLKCFEEFILYFIFLFIYLFIYLDVKEYYVIINKSLYIVYCIIYKLYKY